MRIISFIHRTFWEGTQRLPQAARGPVTATVMENLPSVGLVLTTEETGRTLRLPQLPGRLAKGLHPLQFEN